MTTIHQPACVAWANPVANEPTSADAATEPITAIPSELPTWRLVEATAAATPAWVRGMPDTAVLVIGAFTMPNPAPNTT